MENELLIPPRPTSEPPRWTYEQYQGMEQEISEYLYSVSFWRRWDGKEETLDDAAARARAVAEARFASLSQTLSLEGAMDRAKIWQLYQFKKNGWNFILEYGSVEEVLLAMADGMSEDDTRRYQVSYIVNEVLPALENAGVPAELVTGIPDNFNKLMEAAPRLRRATQEDDIELAKDLLEKVIDPSETGDTVRDFVMGRKPQPLEKIPLETYLRTDGSELTVLRLPSSAHKRFLLQQLKQIIASEETHHILALAQELGDEILSKDVLV